jgi:hypothetical protein
MTPKEKAFELYNYYEQLGMDYTRGVSMNQFSKLCALKAVDEILDVIVTIYDYDFEKLNPYWEEVKQEIEKL